MTVRTRNRLIAFSIIAAPFVFLLCLLLFWDAEPLPPVPPLPHLNGYEDLVKAGQMITQNVSHHDEMNQQELRALVETNSKALLLARAGLQQECRVPLQFSPAYPDLDKMSGLKKLAQAFTAEGELAEKEKRYGDAVKSYLDTIRLGNETARGGLLIDQLVELAVEAVGTSHLQEIMNNLDSKSCRKTAAALETLDSQRQTWDEVMQQERDWSRRTFTGIRYELVRLVERHSLEKIFQNAEQQFDKQRSKTRQLIIEFAARAYELDKGHRPASIADLVPGYLKSIPQDPLTGTNMVYPPR